MPFDPSTATPVSTGFDPSTARPLPPPEPKLPHPYEIPIAGPYAEGDPNLSLHDLGQMARGAATSAVSGIVGFPGDIEAALRAEARHKLGRSSAISPTTVLPTSGDVARALGIETKDERAAGYRELGGVVATLGLPAGPKALRLADRAVLSPVTRLADRAAGTTAKVESEAIRAGGLEKTAELAQTEEQKAAAYAKRLAAVEKAQKSLESQPATAEARAERAALGSGSFTAEREAVLADIRSRTRALEQEYEAAGLSTEHAKGLAAQHEAAVAEAERAVDDLERRLLAQPTISADQFGAQLRGVTKQLSDKFTKIRREQSGFGEAIDSAGPQLRVSTKPILAMIDKQLKDIRNPALERALTESKRLLMTGDKPGLTVRSADSLRGYLDSILQTKMVGEQKVDRETLHFIGDVKKQLVKDTTAAWQPYKEALGRWRTLSRPLDIVERKGALKKVLDADPVSTDWAMTEAQVTGRVISQAKAGNPVFTRLIAESPELRDSARLYFTQDLFGKDVVPTEASLRTWLKANETPLRQLGLYNDFKDIRVARETAAKAVAEAKGVAKKSAADVRAAEAHEREVAGRVSAAKSLQAKARARAEAAQPATPTVGPAQQRAAAAEKRLGREHGAIERERKEAADLAHEFRQYGTDIRTARPKEVPARARAFYDRLRDKGMISEAEHERVRLEIQAAEDAFTDVHELRRRLLRIGLGVSLIAGGSALGHYYSVRNLLGL